MIRVSFANQKGGVGKTTVTLGFAEAAFLCGNRVLVVDCDPQSNLTSGLGVELSKDSKTLVDILKDEVELNENNISQYVYPSSWNELIEKEIDLTKKAQPVIDVIPANGHLSTVESHLANDPLGAFDRLDSALEPIAHLYDYIFYDCPPSMGLLTINALYASDEVIIVSGPSAWSSDGVATFTQNVARISKRLNGRPKLSAIIINNVGRTRDAKFWQNEIIENNNINNSIKTQSISARAAIAEAGAMSQPISALGKRDGAMIASQEFLNAFISIFTNKTTQTLNSDTTQLVGS